MGSIVCETLCSVYKTKWLPSSSLESLGLSIYSKSMCCPSYYLLELTEFWFFLLLFFFLFWGITASAALSPQFLTRTQPLLSLFLLHFFLPHLWYLLFAAKTESCHLVVWGWSSLSVQLSSSFFVLFMSQSKFVGLWNPSVIKYQAVAEQGWGRKTGVL